MKKRYLIIAAVLVICICVAAGIFQHASAEKKPDGTSVSDTSVNQAEAVAAEKIENSTSAADEGQKNNVSTGSGQSNGSSGGKKKKADAPAEQPSEKNTAEKQTAAAPRRDEPAEAEKSTVTVTFSISCQNALDYGADVPSDGYFLSPVSYTAEEGETAFDALKALCRENGISLKYQDVYYIQEIGGLNEKDCGGQSGWMFRVNGTAPNKAACRYILADGDKVEWYYVTSPNDK